MDQVPGLVMAGGFLVMLAGGVLYTKREIQATIAGNKFVGVGFVIMLIGALLLIFFK